MLLLFHSNASLRAVFYPNVNIAMAPQTGRPSNFSHTQFRSSSIFLHVYTAPLTWDIWSRMMTILCFSSLQPVLHLLYKHHQGVTGPWEAESPAQARLWAPGTARMRRRTCWVLLSFEKQLRSTWLWTLEPICLLSCATFMICGFLVWLGFIF